MEENLSTVNAEPVETVETQNDAVNEPVQTNDAVPVEPQQDNNQQQKPVQSPEENAKFAQVRRDYEEKLRAETERARKQAIDDYIAGQGYTWNGKEIKTKDEYDEALQEKELYEKYQSQGLPEDVIQRLAKVDQLERRLDETQNEKKAQELERQKQEAQQKEFSDFMSAFPDVKGEDIPPEVWQARESGIPLKTAYKEYLYDVSKVAEAKAKANAENANASMGAVAGDGTANEPDYISFDTFEQNKSNQSWIVKNYDKIAKSRPKW